MTISTRTKYEPRGLLALEPSAYGAAFAQEPQGVYVVGKVAVLNIRGPLMQHDEPDSCFRTYESIISDARTALAAAPIALVLSFASPGGLVQGCFEGAAQLRSMAAAAGVPLIAYVDGQCCSAAYAWACAASRIVAPAAADVGSIGVISMLADATRQAAAAGMRFAVIASGARKADGNPLTELSAEAIAAKQGHVDEVAGMFFTHVAQARGISPAAVQALEGGFFTGAKAQSLHLVDEVQNLDQLLASLNAPASASLAQTAEKKPMSVKATLQAVIDDDKASDEDKEDAQKALAALGDESDDKAEEGDSDGDEEKPAKKPDDKASADEGDDEEDDKATVAAATAAVTAASATAPVTRAELAAVTARLDAGVDRAKRSKILATRSDLTKAQRQTLAAVPTSALAATLALIPVTAVVAKPNLTAGAIAGVQTTAAAPGGGTAQTFDAKRAAQRRRMGLAASSEVVEPIRVENDKFVFSVAALAQSKSGKVVAK